MSVIRTEQLTKSYGRHRGIVDVNLTVEQGEVFGFLGPNGAGKTTMIRLLLDLIRPTSGRAFVFEKPYAELERIFVRGDRSVDYGTVMKVMGRLSGAGFKRVALVSLVEQGG